MTVISKCWKIRLAVVLCILLGAAAIGLGVGWLVRFAHNAQQTREYLVECTTPGPRPPTRDDPRTGHACYDEGQARTGQAVVKIIDTNGNGKADVQELADALGVSLPTTVPTVPQQGG